MSRYVIIGAGAVGAGLAAELVAAGIEHVLVGRGQAVRHLAEHPLRYVRPDGVREVQLNVVGDPADLSLRETDRLVLATKTQDADAALARWAWQPVRGSSGQRVGDAAQLPIVTTQNGLDAERAAARRFVDVYAGSLLIPARFTKVGEVVAGSAPVVGVFTLGRYPSGLDATAELVAADLRAAGYAVQLSDRVQDWKATKLLHSVKNGLEVLRGEPAEKQAVADLLGAEARAVLTAAGYRFADPVGDRTIDLTGFGVDPRSDIKAGQQSTWQSFARGAAGTEVDFLNGEIVLLGRLFGIATPVNGALQALLGAAAADGDGPGSRSVADLGLELAPAAVGAG